MPESTVEQPQTWQERKQRGVVLGGKIQAAQIRTCVCGFVTRGNLGLVSHQRWCATFQAARQSDG